MTPKCDDRFSTDCKQASHPSWQLSIPRQPRRNVVDRRPTGAQRRGPTPIGSTRIGSCTGRGGLSYSITCMRRRKPRGVWADNTHPVTSRSTRHCSCSLVRCDRRLLPEPKPGLAPRPIRCERPVLQLAAHGARCGATRYEHQWSCAGRCARVVSALRTSCVPGEQPHSSDVATSPGHRYHMSGACTGGNR